MQGNIQDQSTLAADVHSLIQGLHSRIPDLWHEGTVTFDIDYETGAWQSARFDMSINLPQALEEKIGAPMCFVFDIDSRGEEIDIEMCVYCSPLNFDYSRRSVCVEDALIEEIAASIKQYRQRVISESHTDVV